MPATMNISLPDAMKKFVDRRVREGAYAGASDYVRALIRKDQDAAKLRELLREGAASPTEGEFDSAYFDDLRDRIRGESKRRKSA